MSEIIKPRDGARSVLRPNGAVLEDGMQVADTLQCCHCGGHFEHVPGSGRRRGFCLACYGVTCGAVRCNPCRPFEQQLDDREKLARALMR